MDKTFLYQINVTRDCNLRCTHCYIHSEVKAKSQKMEQEQLLFIAKNIAEHMNVKKYNKAEIHIIGGEPTMLGLKFFEEMIPLFRNILETEKINYELMLVSNLLHADILKMALLFDRVSTSYEVKSRFISWAGNPKPRLEEEWLSNVKILKNAGVDIGVTTAMTKPVIDFGAVNILNFFYNNGIKHIHFGFFIPEGDGLTNLNNLFPRFEETSDFLIEATKWTIEKRNIDADLWVNPFESMLTGIANDIPLDDIVCPIISGSLDIHWDGNAAPCLEAGGALNPDWAGNIFADGILKTTIGNNFLKKVMEANKPQKICINCDEYAVCRSACGVLFKFYDQNLDSDCPGFKKFIKFVRLAYKNGELPRQQVFKFGC